MTVRDENNVQGALIIESLFQEVFPDYWGWDYITVMNYLRTGGRIFVAYEKDDVLGAAFLRKMDDRLWELTVIGVFPKHRGKGVGKALMKKVVSNVKGDIFLHVKTDNLPAIRLYESFNFRKVRRIPKFYSTGEDAYLMLLKRTPR